MSGRKGFRDDSPDLSWRSYGLALGDLIRATRLHRELSQEKLAELSGVSRNQISALETNANHRGAAGNPRLDTVYRLAQAMRVPPGALLPDVDEILGREARPLDGDVVWSERYRVYLDQP